MIHCNFSRVVQQLPLVIKKVSEKLTINITIVFAINKTVCAQDTCTDPVG